MIPRVCRSARILVVDDEGMNLRLLRRILEREGYTSFRTTADGKEVEKLVEEFDPHLLILDLHMPPPDCLAILRPLAPKCSRRVRSAPQMKFAFS